MAIRTLARAAAVAVLGALLVAGMAQACTRVLWNDNGLAVVVGRTMDWPGTTEPILMALPRGMERDGAQLAGDIVVPENGLRWTSRYGSVVTTVYGVGAADGFNEKGLGVHMLYLRATEFGPRDPERPGLHAGLWAQYALDNAASVAEALDLLAKVQPVMVELHGFKSTVHLALEDATGDSAIVEYVGGKLEVHHGREYTIMTNDPPYDQQLELLEAQDFSKPSMETRLGGNVTAPERFQRAAYFSSLLPDPKTQREAIASILSVARNASVPFGAPYGDFGVYNTEYRTATDLTNLTYFFELTTSPNVVWINLSGLDLSPGASVRALNPDDIAIAGDITAKLRPLAAPPF